MRFCLSLDADLGKWLRRQAKTRRTTVSAMLNLAVLGMINSSGALLNPQAMEAVAEMNRVREGKA